MGGEGIEEKDGGGFVPVILTQPEGVAPGNPGVETRFKSTERLGIRQLRPPGGFQGHAKGRISGIPGLPGVILELFHGGFRVEAAFVFEKILCRGNEKLSALDKRGWIQAVIGKIRKNRLQRMRVGKVQDLFIL